MSRAASNYVKPGRPAISIRVQEWPAELAWSRGRTGGRAPVRPSGALRDGGPATWPGACIGPRFMPRHFMLSVAPVAAVMALTACPSVSVRAKGELNSTAVDQWRTVQSASPEIAAAYLQSLVALLEETPERA